MSSWRSSGPADKEKSSWRKKGKAVATASTGKYWVTGAGSKPLISGNLVRLFVALTVLVATTVGMVVYLLNTNISTPLVSIAAIDYELPWAPNAWALEDQQRLQALQESSQFRVTTKQEHSEEQWHKLIEFELEKVTPGGPGGSLIPALWGYRSLIVHLSAHGVLNGAGDPCLLFTDADSLDDATWVPLTQVLTAIGDHPTVTSHQARVLVVLDTGKQPPDARCGLLSTGFVEAARGMIQALPFANFAVLLSCAEDQCAWVAPEMNGTVFGVMVASGLQGNADAVAGNGDMLVTVQELARFVAATVDGYVRENRGRGQNPNLIWCGDNQSNDFELCYQSEYATSPASTYQVNSRIEKMTQTWQALDAWNRRVPSYVAWTRAKAASRVARAEQLLWAGAGYSAQFESELYAAQQIINTAVNSPWPRVICGGSLAFLNRVHGLDTAAELKAAGLEPPISKRVQPLGGADLALAAADQPASALPSTAPPNNSQASTTEARTGDAASGTSTTSGVATSGAAADGTGGGIETTSDKSTSQGDEITPAQQIARWLSFDERQAAGEPPPKRPELPPRPLAIGFLVGWLADNPQAVSAPVMERVVDWLGPIVDSGSVTREEALLRTIRDHVQLTRDWELATQARIGQLWSQYLQSADACELAMALIDPRGTKALQRASASLADELQFVRDHILGCETDRDASDCANDLIGLQSKARDVRQLRDRVERGWSLRDELALELPTLAQWIASPLSRLQTRVSADRAWELSGQLSQRLHALQAQLVVGQIPEQVELDLVDQGLEQLAAAYRESLHDVFESNAKGQRKQLSDLVLSLGVRPNLNRGGPLNNRTELHQGLNKRYGDFQGVYSADKLANYYAIGATAASQSAASQSAEGHTTEGQTTEEHPDAIWRLEDLPLKLTVTYTPLLFTETVTARPLASALSTALSPRRKWAALGGELRARWSQLPAQIIERCQASLAAMDNPDETALAAAEEELMRVDYQAHLLAQLIPCDRLNLLPDPTQRTQDVCNAQFALWQARRGLADFWRTPLLPQADKSLFMLGSAADWQAAVPNPVRGPVKLFDQVRLAATEVAHNWEGVWQNIKAAQPPENLWQADLTLSEFPAGRAWISLGLDGNSANAYRFENRRFQTEQGTGGRGSQAAGFSFSTSGLSEGTHQLRAWFRGHTATAAIRIAPQQLPVTLAWQVEEPGRTTLRVDAEPKPARIVFVLDCSGSLYKNNGMMLAKNSLIDLISELEKSNSQTEVAVTLFGHRVEYRNKDADTYSEWTRQVSPAIHPYNDVEIVQPLAAPTPQLVRDLETKLQDLQAFGRTPLYESIRQAADLLLRTRGGFTGELRIVVITDGDDNVLPLPDDPGYNARAPGRLKVPAQFLHTEDDVLTALRDQIRLDFVTFNFEQAGGGQGRLEGLVTSLNKRTRRAGLLSAGAGNLATQLRKSISGTYSTKNLETNITIGSRVRLSEMQPISVDQLVRQRNEFEVQIDDTADRKTVVLLGGETIELQYRREEGLRFLAYEKGDMHPQHGEVSYAGQLYQTMMLTGKPDSVPQVRLCLQSQNSLVQSLRPHQFLLELQRTKPGQDSEQGERLAWTADGLWENHHRSPVLRVMIKNLPDLQRDRLECRVWLPSTASGQSAEALPISRLKEQAIEIVPGIQVLAATEREANGLRVTLTETREPDAPLLHWQVFPAPDKAVEHQVYRAKVVHEYFFIDPLVLSQIEVTATPLPVAPNENWQATPWIPVPEWK